MPARPKHMLMFAGVDTLDTCSRIIHMANAFCDAGTKVSLICPPQRRDNSAELKQVLHPAANVYIALGSVGQVLNIRYVSGSAEAHLPEAACYQLAEYACLPRPAINDEPADPNAPLFQQYVPSHLYEKYKEVILLDYYNHFYFVQALIINKTIEPVDAVFCHDLNTLPVGCLAKELLGIKLLYDSHEICTSVFVNPVGIEIGLRNEKWLYEMCDSFTTVSDACANYYKELCPSIKPLVITNAHRLLWEKTAGLKSLKERLSLPQSAPLAIYVGSLAATSHLDRFIEAITLSRSNLNLAILGAREEIERYKQLSKDLGLIDKRVFFLGRVSYDQVFDTIYGADFGIIPNIQNHMNPGWAILSSKLFDYAQVELPWISDYGPRFKRFWIDLPSDRPLISSKAQQR